MTKENKKISFCINTSNNELDYIKLLFKSFEKNLSRLDHEFVIFIDSDNQNTFEWLISQKSTFINLKILKNNNIPYGNSTSQNILFQEASNDIVSYLHSDMVVCKNYDLEILDILEENMLLCSTRIEPSLHGNAGEKITKDFGLNPVDFDLQSFTEFAESIKQNKVIDYYFAPYSMYKSVWLSIGGHDIQFRRSREDSDMYTRLLLNNVKVKQTWKALAYHFTCTTSRGIDWHNPNNQQAQDRVQMQNLADNFELAKIMRKWGKFNHDNAKLKYYEISAIINGDNNKSTLDKILKIEPFFKKLYFENETIITELFNFYDKESQKPANTLMNVTEDQWKEYKYLFEQDIFTRRINKKTNNIEDDIELHFNIDNITEDHILNFIQRIQDIVDNIEDPGIYESGPFLIHVRKKINSANKNIIVTNPTIKINHMYEIY